MKKISFIITCIIAVSVHAQGFTKIYEPNSLYPLEMRDLHLNSDGTFIAGFDLRNNDSLSYPKAGIMRLDASGSVIWSYTLNIPNAAASCSYEVEEKFDGNYYLYGLALNDSLSIGDSTQTVMNAFLCEFDPNGVVQYYRNYEAGPSGGAYSINSMEILPDDSLQFLVSVNSYVELFKTGPEGHLAWSTRTTNQMGYTGKNPGFDMVVFPDETVIVVCKVQSDLSIIKYDGNGNVLWNRHHSITEYNHIKSLCLASNGELFAVGYATDFGVPYSVYPLLLKIDPSNGDILMAKTFDNLGINYLSMGEVIEDNGTLLITYSGPLNTSIFEKQYILRSDFSGNMIEGAVMDNITLDYGTIEKFNDSTFAVMSTMYFYSYEGYAQVMDDPFFLCGFSEIPQVITSDFTNYQDTVHTYFIEHPTDYYTNLITLDTIQVTDSLTCENLSVLEQEAFELALYPNPTSGEFQIQLSKNIDGSVELVDPNGRVVIREKMLGSIHFINASNLESGVYFIRVVEQSNTVVRRIIVE